MIELQIDDELKAWIDPLSAEEYELLEASIVEEGCRDPLVVWGGYLLDGHNRYEICRKHGIEFVTFEKAGLSTKDDVKIWMIQNQMGKRNATEFTRTALALKLKPLLEQRAIQRKAASQTGPGEQVGQVRQNSDAPKGRTDDGIAKMVGVSRDTVRKVEKIIEKASPKVIEQVRSGEISINAAAKTVASPKPPAPVPAPLQDAPIDTASPPTEDHAEFGPSPEEIAAAERFEAEQTEYIKNLLASEDDPLAKALADLKQKCLEISALRSQNAGHQNTINDQIRTIKSLRSKLAKLEAK